MRIEQVFNKKLQKTVWKIDVTIGGQRIRRAEFDTKREAQDAIASLRLQLRRMQYGLESPAPSFTLAQLRNAHAATSTARSASQMLHAFDLLMDVASPNKQVTDLTRADFKILKSALVERGLSPSTINSYLAYIHAILNDAPEHLAELEGWKPPAVERLKTDAKRDRVLTKDELSRIFQALRSRRGKGERMRTYKHRSDVIDLVRVMLLTGARRGELYLLTPDAIQEEWNTLRIYASKTRTVRKIPLTKTLVEILKQRRTYKGKLFPPIDQHSITATLRRACEDAGILYGDRTPGGWVPHDLRHTAASVIESAGVPYSAVAALLGHKRKDMTAVYTHASLENLQKAAGILEAWCKGIEGFVDSQDVQSQLQEEEEAA